MAPKFNFAKDDRVLDVGCGSGNFTFDIANDVKSVVGIDVSHDMIEYAQQHHQHHNVEYMVCDAQDFGPNLAKWKENQFDKVVSMQVLHWVKDKRKTIQNIYQCLVSGGELFIAVTGRSKLTGIYEDDLPFYLKHHPNWKHFLKNFEHRRYNDFTIADWSNLLETEGFSLVYKEVKTPPRDDIFMIYDDVELTGYIRTLLGHFNYITEERHEEFVEDAVEWCKRTLPLNTDGIMYCPGDIYFMQAIKK